MVCVLDVATCWIINNYLFSLLLFNLILQKLFTHRLQHYVVSTMDKKKKICRNQTKLHNANKLSVWISAAHSIYRNRVCDWRAEQHKIQILYTYYTHQWRLLVFQRGEAHFRPTSYKLSIYLYVNSALRSFSRKCSVTLSYQLGVFCSDLTSVLSMASRARLLKRPWPIVLRV